MRGHMQIIAARRNRMKPAAIFIDVDWQPVVNNPFDEPELALQYGFYPTVFMSNKEAGLQKDMRFVIGCRVHIATPVLTDEVVALAEKTVAAGATGVYCCGTCDGALLIFENGEWHADA